MTRIYLDYAATTPMRPEAIDAMAAGMARWANPSSPHAEGRAARAALEEARARIKAALGWTGELIFTSGASEALWIALNRAKVERRVVSAVEHDAVFRAAAGAEVVPIAGGAVDGEALASLLSGPGRAVVAVQHVNSETGTIQPVSALAAQVRAAGGIVVSDCAQSAGKLALPDADLLVVSAHKLGGPPGIGALLVRDFGLLEPVGGHEFGYRMGTENLPAILGFAAAAEHAGPERWPVSADALAGFRAALGEAGTLIAPAGQAAHILAIAMPGKSAAAQLIRFDAMGFAVSAGSACSSGTLKRSRALEAFGIDEDSAARTIRVSFGWNTTPAEIAAFRDAWLTVAGA
ncbi:aminotransferase class V-fold PLP-dependent enzyme [Sphingomonas sp.]|uniref:cysteine desulfurase family protein n=1 Tax=Sphingomonas sp. TaxID=28214 RepID=UPI001D3CDEA6|nr:aminotransferase class V-fold PLP-dependent enzyme [Sphingomonas sp.]MBX9796346.1 aminotransferase class V-fold PLP-dependent enzyme [Sphingomonas sp.]